MFSPTYKEQIKQTAEKYGLDFNIFLALIYSESGGENLPPRVVHSKSGDFTVGGIAQIYQAGSGDYKYKDLESNLDEGGKRLKSFLDQSGGDYEKAIYKYKGLDSAKTPSRAAELMSRFKEIYDLTQKTNGFDVYAKRPDFNDLTIMDNVLNNKSVIDDAKNRTSEDNSLSIKDFLDKKFTASFLILSILILFLFAVSIYVLIAKFKTNIEPI